MAVTRNPTELLRRLGIVDEPARPSPRLDSSSLLIHTVPIESPFPGTEALLDLEGDHPPDHGLTQPWPGQTQTETDD